MAPHEMDQDHRQKSGWEEREHEVQDQIRAKEQDLRELREEIRAKEQEIRAKEQEIREVEKEIPIASEAEVTELLKAKLQFLQQDISSIRQDISSIRQEMISIRQELSSLLPVREAPASADCFAGPSSGVPQKFFEDWAEFLADYRAEQKSKKSVCLSSVSQSMWAAIERQEGLDMVFKDIESELKRSSDLPAFGWDERQERAQADRYIPHLNKIACGRKWRLIDANNHPTLLSGSFGGWNFRGTTDVAFVHRIVEKTEARRGLRCIFELEKNLQCGDRQKAAIQAVICLLMANVFAKQFKPFSVLTDLDDCWSLYWLDGSTIFWYTFKSRASAVGYIEELLQDSNYKVGTSETLPIHACPHGEDDGLQFVKRRKV